MLHSHHSTFQVPLLPSICPALEMPNAFPFLGLCTVDTRRGVGWLLLNPPQTPGLHLQRSKSIAGGCLSIQQAASISCWLEQCCCLSGSPGDLSGRRKSWSKEIGAKPKLLRSSPARLGDFTFLSCVWDRNVPRVL